MKKLVFYLVFVFAVSSSFNTLYSCNAMDKEFPVYTEKINTVNEKDKAAIISSYVQEIKDATFIDSAKRVVSNDSLKKILPGLIDFYSDQNGHLKSLALDKNIELSTIAEIEKSDTFNIKGNVTTDKEFIAEVIKRIKKTIALFNKYADECDDTDTKNYFSDAYPFLQKQLDRVSGIDKIIK